MAGKRKALTGMAAGAGGIILLLVAIALVVIYSGFYNIAATEEHRSMVRWAFDTTFQNSVERHAADVSVPGITDSMITAGARHYKATCQMCHSGPGAKRAEWASGMRPRPPHLAEAATEWELQEIYWLAKHGAKMTGMPAFGPTHDDQTLWSIAAFVKELPAMTPGQYQQAGGHGNGGTAHHEEGH